MARIAAHWTKDTLPPEAQAAFDEIAASRGVVQGPFAVLLNSPELARRTAHLGAYCRFHSALPPDLRELAILTAARETDCQYEWSLHAVLAREAGTRQEAIEVVAQHGPLEALTDREAIVVGYGRDLLRGHRVSQAAFDRARQEFGDQGVVDLTSVLGYYAMLALTLNAFEVQPEPGSPRLP